MFVFMRKILSEHLKSQSINIDNSTIDSLEKSISPMLNNYDQDLVNTKAIENESTIVVLMKNCPFIIDTITNILKDNQINPTYFIHPIITHKDQKLSLSIIGIDQNIPTNYIRDISNELEKDLGQNLFITNSFSEMKSFLDDSIKDASSISTSEIEMLNWMKENYIFLGCSKIKNKEVLKKLGLFDGDDILREEIQSMQNMSSNKMTFCKTVIKTKIHRHAEMDCVIVPAKDGSHNIFVGFFTTKFYTSLPAKEIPILKDKIKYIEDICGFDESSYNIKHLNFILNTFPRYELLNLDAKKVFDKVSYIVQSPIKKSYNAVIARQDDKLLYITIVMDVTLINHANYNKIMKLISKLNNFTMHDESIKRNHGFGVINVILKKSTHSISDSEVESIISNGIKSEIMPWDDVFINCLIDNKTNIDKYKNLKTKYVDAFPIHYMFDKDIESFLYQDIMNIDNFINTGNNIADISNDGRYIMLYLNHEIKLSKVIKSIESTGIEIINNKSYNISINDNNCNVYHLISGKSYDMKSEARANLINFILNIVNNSTEDTNDLNQCILSAGISHKQVCLFDAYISYLRQIKFRYDRAMMERALSSNGEIVKLLVSYFDSILSPSNENVSISKDYISDKIGSLKSQVEKIIFTKLLEVIDATMRTNFYQENHEYISLKIKSSAISDMPKPVPFAEIFVHSKYFEGSHLRNSPISRGGFRWSDRGSDFRTEVLGLVKAQIAKNSIIVPSGAKGCFYVKDNLPEKTIQESGLECYKMFVSGLLDLTDNIINGDVVTPKNVVRRDDKDPYIVAAADKGTATFSDVANSISAKYNFWLGDAFASGGGKGYDHKKLGITSRGAFVTLKNNLFELGIDVDNQEISCVGIGDMSGDVFGNGMLLIKKMKLIAAFNHIHIFIDPNPDIEKSLNERKRMFANPKLKWSDYDKSTISQGGGVFDRFGDNIEINDHIRKALDIPANISSIEPENIIPYILKANVDVIWNGGIGTFIKASFETNESVMDKFNDNVRINGNEIRAKVFTEGGNIGVTQKGRIEYAMNGGKINVDAIDNSAGVSCSDHEVNIKIAFNTINKHDQERDDMLARMEPEVVSLVLADNYKQSKLIGFASHFNKAKSISIIAFADMIQEMSILDKSIENLPSIEEVEERLANGLQGMTRPEICVVMSYAKIYFKQQIINSKILNDKFFEKALIEYFPREMQEKYHDVLLKHPLRRDIIATFISNDIVNTAGIDYVYKMHKILSYTPDEIVKIFYTIKSTFGVDEVMSYIYNMDFKCAAEDQYEKINMMHNGMFNISSLVDFDVNLDASTMISLFAKDISNISDKMLSDCKMGSSCCMRKNDNDVLKNMHLINKSMKIGFFMIAKADPEVSAKYDAIKDNSNLIRVLSSFMNQDAKKSSDIDAFEVVIMQIKSAMKAIMSISTKDIAGKFANPNLMKLLDGDDIKDPIIFLVRVLKFIS
jgi:glutamate dehydrogenase